jgi:hypothetical protein
MLLTVVKQDKIVNNYQNYFAPSVLYTYQLEEK